MRVLVKVIIDHESLKYFITTNKLTRRQIRWPELLPRFNIIIFYTLDKKSKKVDVLAQCQNDLLDNDNDDYQQYLL